MFDLYPKASLCVINWPRNV